MSDFFLDITIKQRAFGIRARIHPRTGQRSVRGKSTTRLCVLVINLVQGTPTNVTEVTLNQGIVVGRYITSWLPENSIYLCGTGHDRTIVVRDVVAAGTGTSAGCFIRPSLTLVRKDMHLMGLDSSGRC